MNYWIFQAVTERYDLREKLVEGETVTWYATRYTNYMTRGDIVFFWLGGSKDIRGIYGWGKLTSGPEEKPEWNSYGVRVKYVKRLKPHLEVEKMETDPVLKNMLILRMAVGTNFLLKPEEGQAIVYLIGDPELKAEVG